jgi:hypothetical protein
MNPVHLKFLTIFTYFIICVTTLVIGVSVKNVNLSIIFKVIFAYLSMGFIYMCIYFAIICKYGQNNEEYDIYSNLDTTNRDDSDTDSDVVTEGTI